MSRGLKRKFVNDISGLTKIDEYIPESLEQHLLAQIDTSEWLTSLKRRVQHYGYRYDYKTRQIDSSLYLGELPRWSNAVTDMLYKESFISDMFDQLIVNEYQPGQGISPHVDCIPCFHDTIVSLSLGSRSEMVFTGPNNERVIVSLNPRTLIVLQKDARYKWKHSIPSRKSDLVNGVRFARGRRVSLTFRKVVQNAID